MHNTTGEQRIKIKQGLELNGKIIVHPICHFSCFYKFIVSTSFIYLFIFLDIGTSEGCKYLCTVSTKNEISSKFQGCLQN